MYLLKYLRNTVFSFKDKKEVNFETYQYQRSRVFS